MVYALDTNIVINYLRDEPNIHQNFNDAVMRGDDLVVPEIVNYEIRRGFRIISAPKKEAAYKVLVGPGFCDIAEMDVNCWERAEYVYLDLYNKRLTVGEMDILIAAICIEYGYTLVTNNTKDFENIDGLKLVNWIK